MSGEHIGRKQSIGLGKEGTAGTAIAVDFWIPKLSGAFTPKTEVATDEGAYGIIDKVKEVTTIKNWSEVQFSAIARDVYFGHILMALFGTTYPTVRIPVSGVAGTFVEGETVTESVSSATATIRRVDLLDLYVVPVSGTLVGGGKTLTGGTSAATATDGTIIPAASGKHHMFRRLNSNAHPSYTIYGSDPVGDDRAAYCMLSDLEFECVVGDFAKFTATFMGKALSSTTTQTPAFTAQNAFSAKFASCKIASAFSGLDAASAVDIERITLKFPKNLTNYVPFGSTSPSAFFNQEFGEITGEITLLYNAVTQRDYVLNSTKRAMRLTIANTDATAISGSSYPTMQFDMPLVGFREFSRTTENGGIVKQTLGFTAEFDVTRSMSIESTLSNTRLTTY
jgi:tail tube protein